MNSFKIVLRADAPLPTSVMEDGLIISVVQAKHELELIVQDGEDVCKSTFIVGAGIGGETAIKVAVAVEVEVEPADDGGTKVIKVKVKSSAEPAQADDVAANFKVKLD